MTSMRPPIVLLDFYTNFFFFALREGLLLSLSSLQRLVGKIQTWSEDKYLSLYKFSKKLRNILVKISDTAGVQYFPQISDTIYL